ncbi:retrovirus-related Pol polyprotein from transposon 412 [Trichonephila clavipes]|nr:retrovirus-related Pol polyprotein from transposon 412 [Trichonephila clavipes]
MFILWSRDPLKVALVEIHLIIRLSADTSKESDIKFLVKEVSKFIHRFDLKEDISLYLKLFERQAQRLNIDQENWVSHLLGLLPTEVSHIIAREPDDKANSYEHVKDLLLKRFKLTPEKFRQLFVTHQKAPERTWIDFYHELNTYFNGWIDGLKIDTFKKLSDLIITDQLKRKTPFEFKEYYLNEWANMNSPVLLAEKLEEFKDFKRTLKQKSSSPFVKKQEYKSTEKNHRYEAPGKFEYNRKDKKFTASTNYNKHYEAPVTKYESVQRYQNSAQKGYYNKNYEKHSNHNASKHAQTNYSKSQKFKEPPKETCTLIVEEEELDLRHVENRHIKKELKKLILDYKPEKTAPTDVTMRIILKDEEPVCQPPRRLAFTERQEVNKQIEKWLNEGIIRPSSLEYASPIIMVKKKDGSSRMRIDYRKLNQKLVKDKFPLPLIEDVLDTLQEAKVYSTLDLRNGFFHVDVDEDCKKYTSFIHPRRTI